MSELYEKSLLKLELDKVLEMLAECAGSRGGKEACLRLRPISDLEDVQALLDETTAASDLCTRKGNPAFGDVQDVSASLAGYSPDLFGCHVCGSQAPAYFDISGGALLCEKCLAASTGIRMPIKASILDAMRYIVYCDPKKLFSFEIGQEAFVQLSSLTEAYLTTQLERGFSTLDFYKSLHIGETYV